MESEILSDESGSYEKQITLCVWNISGLRSKLNEMNDNFKQFISSLNELCFVKTWGEIYDQFQIDGFLEPFIMIRDKHPKACRNSGGIAVFINENFANNCKVTQIASRSNSKNLMWLKFDFFELQCGIPITCGFTNMSPEN